jgi:hypothetical protein
MAAATLPNATIRAAKFSASMLSNAIIRWAARMSATARWTLTFVNRVKRPGPPSIVRRRRVDSKVYGDFRASPITALGSLDFHVSLNKTQHSRAFDIELQRIPKATN